MGKSFLLFFFLNISLLAFKLLDETKTKLLCQKIRNTFPGFLTINS